MFEISWIKQKVESDTYYFTRHGDQERKNDNLSIAEIEEAIQTGKILEQYTDTGRGKSCLAVGFTQQGKPIHIVCGEMENELVIITVYIPMPPKFKNPYQREVKK